MSAFALRAKERPGRSAPVSDGKRAPCHPDRAVWARGLCKSCYDKWLRENNPEYAAKQKANVRGWAKRNTQRRIEYRRQWQAERGPDYGRMKTLVRYGMTLADYDAMLARQGGGCAICGRAPVEGKPLHVDHSHDTGAVRGLLCFRCNYGWSFFSEQPDRLERAATYVRGTGR